MLAKRAVSSLPMIGNHDHRETYLELFSETATDGNGYVQYLLISAFGNMNRKRDFSATGDEATNTNNHITIAIF